MELYKFIERCVSLEVAMKGRQPRRRRVTTSAVETFFSKRLDIRHFVADELSRYAWSADFGLAKFLNDDESLYTLVDIEV